MLTDKIKQAVGSSDKRVIGDHEDLEWMTWIKPSVTFFKIVGKTLFAQMVFCRELVKAVWSKPSDAFVLG